MKCGIDVDGILASFHTQFSSLLRQEYGDHIPILKNKEEVKEWEYYKYVPISKEQEDQAFEKVRNDRDFWLRTPQINQGDFYYFVKELNNVDFLDMYFVTTRSNTGDFSATKATAMWLETYGWRYPQVIANVKDRKKSPVISTLGIEVFLDDSGKNCVDIADNCPDCEVYMMDYPHNQNTKHPRIKRVHSLREYIDIVKNKMEKKNGR